MKMNLELVPFSRMGSYYAFSVNPLDKGLYLTTMHGDWEKNMRLLQIIPRRGVQRLAYFIEATPWELVLKTKYGSIQITMDSSNAVLIKGNGISLDMKVVGENLAGGLFKQIGDDALNCTTALYHSSHGRTFQADVDFWGGELKSSAYCTKGSMYMDNLSRWLTVTPDENSFEVYLAFSALEGETLQLPENFETFDPISIQQQYTNWLSGFKLPSAHYKNSALLAYYIIWSSTVCPRGNLTTNTVLMSKNYMHYVWSWDNCFNALALVENHNQLALEQLQVIFNKQYENGKIVDRLFPLGGTFNCVKPPVHGWCVSKLLDSGLELSSEELENLYNSLKKWTNWWFTERDYDNDGICQYNWNNESGYDNASNFDHGLPVEAPDLTAYLILQLRCLARLAEKLGRVGEMKDFAQKSEEQLKMLINHFWQDDQFVSIHVPTHKAVESKSLANLLPLVLGDLLPEKYFKRLVEIVSVEYDFLTPYSLATEAMSSKTYNIPSSEWNLTLTYWRGSIWAATTYLIVDGLRRGGEKALAKEIATRFCNLVNGKEGIFENYCATTGIGQCDSSYTWTCSVYLLLLKEFLL